MQVVCAMCEEQFEAKRSTAKFCGDACRQHAKRGASEASNGGLVRSVENELEDAGVLDTYPGQLAVELAKQMTAAGATGIASLSKELRNVMVSALDGSTPGAAEPEIEDEVDKARRAREHKASAAAS